MPLINEVHIGGFVASEPQQSGRGPHRFRLSHGGGKKKDGSQWPTQFFSVSVWDAKIVPQKGQRIELWGKLRQNEYTDKAGNKRESVEVVAEAIQAEQHQPATPPQRGTPPPPPSSGPMANCHGLAVSDADIPF